MSLPSRRSVSLLIALAVICSLASSGANAVDPALDFSPTPQHPSCATAPLREATQGRTPRADFLSGRAEQGYMCNASEVSHQRSDEDARTAGALGGYRVHRYIDRTGRTCAFYDTTLLFPASTFADPPGDSGVWVLDMTDPANPVHTATLATPAMQSPHESFSLNQATGLLGAVFANPLAHAGQFDLYDASADCRRPTLMSSLPMGILGHEGSFAPDGKTYYASSLYAHTVTAIDTSIPLAPRILWTSAKWNMHGMNLSEDGNLLYFADVGRNGADDLGDLAGTATKGLTILDVSEIQARAINPQVKILSHLTWPHVGTPQTVLPITVGGVKYAVEIDEFGGADNVGAARIINIEDPEKPSVVSNIRLAVNNLAAQNDPSQRSDPNATNSLGGYRGHYCAVPTTVNPTIVACTFILSGLRVFDISDLAHPVEIAYFNKPATSDQFGTGGSGAQGSYAMSQPAFDVARKQIWYSDGNSGFYVVQIENGVW